MAAGAISNVRRFEGMASIKGFRIGYVLWVPVASSNGTSLGYDAANISVDPMSMTNHFDETIVCFHGWLDNANSFATLAPLLATKFNMRVIGVDLPGHGKSSHSKLGYYTMPTYCTAIVRLLHRLRLRAFHLMAHSLSAVCPPLYLPLFLGIRSVIL